jgi:hypothetical protein
MPLNKKIKRELEVAFSKDSQPVWFRIAKYVVLIAAVYFFWESKLFWAIIAVLIALALILHLWYRYKTQGWTKSYGLWKHDKKKEDASS